jgi:two-component system NtrC family sensor kinase
VLENQGLLGIAFFEATAFVILLVLFFLFRRDHHENYYQLWFAGWCCLTLTSFGEVAQLLQPAVGLGLALILGRTGALLFFLAAVIHYTAGEIKRDWPMMPLAGVVLAAIYYAESGGTPQFEAIHWTTAALHSAVCLIAGWLMWRKTANRRGHGARLLAGVFFLSGLHGLDRPMWRDSLLFVLRLAFDHLLGVALGIAMVVLVLEGARTRADELNDKMKRLALLTTASTQTLSVQEVLDRVLAHIVESLGASHGMVRLIEEEPKGPQLVVWASVGFTQEYLKKHARYSAKEPWAQQILGGDSKVVVSNQGQSTGARQRMEEAGINESIMHVLPGKDGPLGVIVVGSKQGTRFQADEIAYLANLANLLGLTLQNVRLFEQVASVQHQWAYTFDSIGDPIFVHDRQGRILRSNKRLSHLLGREVGSVVGRGVVELLPRKDVAYQQCPYCEGVAGEGDEPDPWLPGYFLASNSTFTDPSGQALGTIHVLKDITDRKRAEEKYRTLISSVQEGVFISTPAGKFFDFNDALLRMTGYESREELLAADISKELFVNAADRERLKKLLNEHGTVADFEFEMRRKDGEIRNMLESSIAVRDAAGNVSAYQGFLLDITERKRAEQEIRRRNRELMVLNSISQTLNESMDLSDSLHRTLRQMVELFSLDVSSLYLFEQGETMLRRVAAVGHRAESPRTMLTSPVPAELVQHIKTVHATFLSAQGLPLPGLLREAQRKEGLVSVYIVILWSKDRIIGGLAVGSRTPREFSPADINLLIAVGSQISSATERTLLYDETRQAYDNLRRTQEQLLHSEKMAAVGQLISGVAHELNNPLTAILGYSQLLTSSGQLGPLGIEYSDKLYKQAQRTHRIVQNLLSFARQHKPERMPVQLNQILEDTLALRDYDLRVSNVRIHLNFAEDLPLTAADPHQLQQVFLNMVNNAVDAILERSPDGDLWVRTGRNGGNLFVEFVDSGPGVQDASRVFDPFYTTKPVGKGTGLGLSICYGIVTEHGGTIRVRNVPTRGASFTVELPCQSTTESPVNEQTRVAWEPSRRGSILLLDQDHSVLEAVEAILRGRNHQVRAARTIAEAKKLLETESFDVVVVDQQISEAGKSFQDWVDESKTELAHRLILTCTLGEQRRGSERGETNRRAVLYKPFKAAELLSAVDELLLNTVDAAAVDR